MRKLALAAAALLFLLPVPGSTQMEGDGPITIALNGGAIVLRDIHFIRYVNMAGDFPELAMKVENDTSSPWSGLKLQLNIGYACEGDDYRQVTVPVTTSVDWNKG